ncbi:hypothetical protein PGO05_03560 [Klebsiella aerogenes]
MEDENDVSSNGATFDVGAAFFGSEAKEPDPQSPESGDGTLPEITDPEEPESDISSDDSGEAEGDSGTSEAVEVWEFNGSEFTAEQVSDALKHRETFERFNTSITPLIDNIKNFGQTAERMQAMAVTETEKQIAELKQRLNSGRLDSREYQQTHQMLQNAETRMSMLEEAAGQEMRQRQQALNNARTHNARQVATNLVKAGWTKQQMDEAQSVVQGIMKPEQFADIVSPEFMSILRDAAELRRNKADAAAKLQGKVTKAVRVNGKKEQAAPAKAQKIKVGSPEWINQQFWGGK